MKEARSVKSLMYTYNSFTALQTISIWLKCFRKDAPLSWLKCNSKVRCFMWVYSANSRMFASWLTIFKYNLRISNEDWGFAERWEVVSQQLLYKCIFLVISPCVFNSIVWCDAHSHGSIPRYALFGLNSNNKPLSSVKSELLYTAYTAQPAQLYLSQSCLELFLNAQRKSDTRS